MKVVILTIGTFGDVQPYVALGMGLLEAGFQVRLATHEPFRQFVESHGLEFSVINGDPLSWARGEELQSLVEAGSDFNNWMRRLRSLAKPLIESILNSCWYSCRDADAIIYSPLAWAGYTISEKLKIPCFPASMQPFYPTGCFPSVWTVQGLRLGAIYNKATHLFVEQAYWHFNRPFINRWRRATLSLPTIPTGGPYNQERWRRQQFLFGYSPSFLPRPLDWPDNVHATGYWFLKRNQSWQPSAELLNLLHSGTPPVYVGFGSLPDRHSQELREIIVKALAITRKRGVILMNTIGLEVDRISDDIIGVGWTPHEWLFPQMSVIVHHGGASTTANSLRSGVPSVVVPSAWDQPFWGRKMAESGVGPKPIPRKRLSVERLALAIQTATEDKNMSARAKKMRDNVQREDGVGEAVRIIKSVMQKGD